jgi:hypothetical protein
MFRVLDIETKESQVKERRKKSVISFTVQVLGFYSVFIPCLLLLGGLRSNMCGWELMVYLLEVLNICITVG